MTKQGSFFLWCGLAVIIGLIVWGVMAGGPATTTSGSVPGITTTDHVLGPTTAPAVLIEYSDFQCPACGLAEPILKQVKEKYGDRVALVYRHFPLPSHQYGRIAAQASEAAHRQGKFAEFHDLLFDRQSSWSRTDNGKKAMVELATELKLDVDKFTADLDSREVKDRVETDVRTGNAANIPGTPTFFLNGKQIQNPGSLGGFSSLIDAIVNTNS